MNRLRKTAAYLAKISESEYGGLPRTFGSIINYALDSYFHKLSQLNPPIEIGPMPPADIIADLKEKWLGCEVHKCLVINENLPAFARSLNAYGFAMLFFPFGGEMAPYQIIPFLDAYEWKNLIKGHYDFTLQQESIRVSLNDCITLPVYGTFFVEERSTKKRMIVNIDLCVNSMGCKFTVTSSPKDKSVAEKFLGNLLASRTANDIYYKKCLTFDGGSLDFCEVSPTTWDEIILRSDIKEAICHNTTEILGNCDAFASIGLTPSRNVLLISPPGMAKTSIFRAVSNQSYGVNTVIWCTGKSIQQAQDVTGLFEAARSLSPCIIMIEDMDLFGSDRSRSMYAGSNHILNEFLACLDGTKENSGVVVMASTNDVASMDEALVNRPGRFDVKLEMPLPNATDRHQMIQVFCKQYKAEYSEPSIKDALKNIIGLTDGLTGAYIKDLVKCAVIRAVSHHQINEDGCVSLKSDDLLFAANQIMKNFEIGKKAKKHHELSSDASTI